MNTAIGSPLWQAATLILPLIMAIVCHEVAHGWVARMLGDPTARDAGRLTLNPLRHADPIGTLVVPGMLALLHLPVFGWAKPVPVDKWRLRNPRYGMMAVAAAGPATNFALAALGAIALGLIDRHALRTSVAEAFLGDSLDAFVAINIFLALFNLLPVPPFDGSHIVEGLLPRRAARAYDRMRPYGLMLMLVLLVGLPYIAPNLGIVRNLVAPPFEWTYAHYAELTRRVAGA